MKPSNRFPVLLLRITLGILFTIVSLPKLTDMKGWIYGKEAPPAAAAPATASDESGGQTQPPAVAKRQGGLLNDFAGKLPRWMLVVFGYLLPFVEFIGGVLLIVGIAPWFVMRLMALTLLVLTFGLLLLHNIEGVGRNTLFVLLFAVAMKWGEEKP